MKDLHCFLSFVIPSNFLLLGLALQFGHGGHKGHEVPCEPSLLRRVGSLNCEKLSAEVLLIDCF